MHADSAATFVKQNQPITGAVILSNKPTKSAFGADKDYIDFSTICIHLQTPQNRLTANKDLNSSAIYCANKCLKWKLLIWSNFIRNFPEVLEGSLTCCGYLRRG